MLWTKMYIQNILLWKYKVSENGNKIVKYFKIIPLNFETDFFLCFVYFHIAIIDLNGYK